MASSTSNRFGLPPNIDTSLSREVSGLPSISIDTHNTWDPYALPDPSPTRTVFGPSEIPSLRISMSSNDFKEPRASTSSNRSFFKESRASSSSNRSSFNESRPSSSSNITTSSTIAANPTSRAKSESRKLLTHVLYQLLNRRRPPPFAQTIADFGHGATEGGSWALADLMRGVASIRKSVSKDPSRVGEAEDNDGSDDEQTGTFSTEATYELMAQLQDLLSMSLSLGWQLFDDDSGSTDQQPKERDRSSRFRRRKSSSKMGQSRSPSPNHDTPRKTNNAHLLSLCISILASIVSEDCRFQIISHRPSRPPNSLQIATLNVAQFLINTHRQDPRVISQIGFAVIPAFSTFPREMRGRLMMFFQDAVIRGLLETLYHSQRLVASEISASSIVSPIEDGGIGGGPVVQIQIDEVHDDSISEGIRNLVKIQSSNAPHQPASVYYLASLVAPLLAAVLEAVDATSLQPTHELAIRFYGLLEIVASLKVDAYNDLLQIAAYHTPQSRKSACALLSTLWPKIIGHATVSRSLSIPLSLEYRKATIPWIAHRGHAHHHQFVPWQFIQRSSWSNFQGIPQYGCSLCSTSIHGFGLLCPFCMCAVHWDCYEPPDGTIIQHYTMAQDASAQRVAVLRLSSVIPSGGEPSFHHNHHNFELVTIFTLSLCYLCHQPLWGCIAQGAKCTTCSYIAHTSCLLSPEMPVCGAFQLDSEHMTIDHKALRQSALNQFPELRWTDEQLGLLSYEEVLIIYDNLRTQLQLILNGVEGSSIIVAQRSGDTKAKEHILEGFELTATLDYCKRLLASMTSQKSAATLDYMEENRIDPSEHSILYDFSNLVYLTTAMKCPIFHPVTPSPSADLLNVDSRDPFNPDPPAVESIAHPYEAVPLSHMRDTLNMEFNLRHPVLTQVLLSHLFHLSFFERLDPRQNITIDPVSDDALCAFPLPLGLDMSADVETLVASIETCLSDLDLSVNEFGFLLLVRKFWPNGLMSDYGLRRLARGILSWIIAEDDNLATIIRDYVAKQRPLPGVRSMGDMPPWPFAHPVRGGSQPSNGRDYMTARSALLTRYALPWLLSLHDQDKGVYIDILYDTCVELAEDRLAGSDVFDENMENMEANSLKRLDAVLFAILKISHASITFTCSEELVLRWLKLVSDLGMPTKASRILHSITGLNRLFPREADFNRTSSIDADVPKSADKESTPTRADPLDILLRVAQQSPSSLSQALGWLVMIARSGVDIPISIFDRFTSLVATEEATLRQAHSLVHAMTLSLWLRSIGRQYFQTLLGRLHSFIAAKVVLALKGKDLDARGSALVIIRHTLAACLLIYGCERPSILSSGLLDEPEIKDLPSRRKLGSRVQPMDDPIVVDSGILQGIAQYLRLDEWQFVISWIAKFFHLFFTASPLVASYEVDNFILKNGSLMAECAWKFYGIQKDDIAAIRTHFLLRIIAVDAEPFQNLIDGGLNPDLHWERRLVTTHRLSRIVADVTSPAFHIDGRQWRSSIGEIFASFFSLLWKDAHEEIRLSVRVITSGLMPPQIEAIAHCWNETLSKSPMADKIRLVSFLILLRPHFPGTQLISWDNLLEAMEEYDGGTDPDISGFYSAYSNHGELDTIHLLSASLILSLSMIADGVHIEPFTLLKIKVELIRLFGFADLSVTPSQDASALYIQYGAVDDVPDVSYPCLDALVSVVDAPHTIDMPTFAWGVYQEQDARSINLLVGYTFADVLLNLLSTVDGVESMPVLPLKNLLEATYIILHKIDFDVHPARGMQPLLRRAMDRVIELAPKNLNYEVRQLALTVIQAFCRRCFLMIRAGQTVFAVLENVTEVIVSLNQQSQDTLVVQGKSLILNLLSEHSNDGLMINLFKRPLKPTFFAVLKQILDAQKIAGKADPDPLVSYLWRDALNRAPDCDPTSMQLVIENLAKFAEAVYHRDYSYEMITFTGQQVAAMMRRLSDNLFDSIDCSPLLSMLARLSKHNRKHSRELLPYIETALRVALTRGSITAPCLVELIIATQPKVLDSSTPLGKVISTLVEILGDSLRLKARVLPTTLKAIIESLTSEEVPVYQDDPQMRFRVLMANLVENGCYFLDHHAWFDAQTENDFNVSLSVAKIVFQTMEQDPTATNSSVEITYKLVNSLRSWIVLAIAALQEGAPKSWVSILFRHFPSFSHTYLSSMRTYAQSNLSSESAASDINYAYIAAKSWLMVAHRVSNTTRVGEVPMLRVWNEVWPAFVSIVDALEVEARAGLSSTLLILASATIAELLIFLRNLRAPLALDIASHMEILSRLKAARGDVENAKVTRAFRAMSEAPADVSTEYMLEQIAKETIAAEKMKNLEAKRDMHARAGDSRWLPR